MKTQQSFFANLFGEKGGHAKETTSPSSNVIVTSSSQPHVLQRKMQEKGMTHGETVKANISPVKIESIRGVAVMYFCPVNHLDIIETVSKGDGGEIPEKVTVGGLNIPAELKSGWYMLKNVIVSSNGAMQVMATTETEWESCSHIESGITSNQY